MSFQYSTDKIIRILVLIFFVFSLAIGTAGYFFFQNQKRHLVQQERDHLRSIADLKMGQIHNWRQERLAEATILLENPFIGNHIQEWLESPWEIGPKKMISDWMAARGKYLQYERVSLLDLKGTVRLSFPEGEEVLAPVTRRLASEAIREKRVILSDLYRGFTGKIRLSLVVPILIRKGQDAFPVGVLLLRIDPYQFLYPLIQSWPTPSETSETILVRREGEEVEFLNELRHRKDTALILRIPLSKKQVPTAMAVHGKETIEEGMDYRGVPVVAAMRRIPDSSWFIVAKIDQEEIYAPIHRSAWEIGIVASLLIIGMGLIVTLIYRQQRVQFYKRLYRAEQDRQALAKHFDYLTKYANDIVLLMDENLNIIEANDRAVESYGCSREALQKMNLRDLWVSEGGDNLEEQKHAIDEQGAVLHENLHQRKDGMTFPVESSSRVIEIEGRRFYQSIIRDITERKRAEEELAEARRMLGNIAHGITDGILLINKDFEIIWANEESFRLAGCKMEEIVGNYCHKITHHSESPCQPPHHICPVREVINTGNPVTLTHTHFDEEGNKVFVDVSAYPVKDERGEIIQFVHLCRDITEGKRMEESLRSEKERFKTLSEQAPFGMMTIEEDGTFRYINPKSKELFGYDLSDVPDGKTWFRKAYPDPTYRHHVIGTWIKDLEECKRGEKRSKVFTVTCKDGTEKIINFIAVQLTTGENLMACEDITERKRAEGALRESERRFQELFNDAPVGYFQYDTQGRITDVNQTELEMLGYTLEEMIGRSPWEFVVEEEEARNQIFAKLAGTRPPGSGFERTYRRKDGTTFPAICENRISRDGEGKIIGISSTIQDITERRRTEEALRESEEKYRTILENIEDSYYEVDLAGNFTFFNDSVCRLLRYSRDELMGMNNREYMDQENSNKLYQISNKVYRTGEPTKGFDWEIIRKDGTKRYIEASISLVKNPSGRPIGFRGIVRDVTEQNRMREEQLKTEKLQSLGILAGGLAHDFNNLLTSILGNIDFAKSFVKPGDKIFNLLERAETSSHRASDLAKQLITFSKGGAPVKSSLSIVDILQSATSFALAGSNVTSAFHIPKRSWNVEADEGQVRQVIHSMVLNARDAMPEGGVVFLSVENVTVSLKDGLPLREGDYVRMSIKDEGIGIPAENIPRIFDPYFTTKERGNQKGMGLGLSVCYSIVKNHQGSITVESKVGVGTTFHIYFPVSPEKVEEERGEGKISRRKRVLAMDDEEEVRKILEETLMDAGYEAALARDGSEAIKLYQEAKEAQRPFDAVILDLTVPGGMSGKEAIKRLLEMDPEVKAIVSSGYHKDPVMLEFKEYGFKVALAKPYKISTLKRVLSDVTG